MDVQKLESILKNQTFGNWMGIKEVCKSKIWCRKIPKFRKSLVRLGTDLSPRTKQTMRQKCSFHVALLLLSLGRNSEIETDSASKTILTSQLG